MQVGVGGTEHASQEGTATNVRVGGGGRGVGIVVVGVVWMGIGLMTRRPSALLGRSVVNHNLLTSSSSSSSSCSSTTLGPSRHAATTTATTTTAVNPIDTADESSRRCPSTVATTHTHAHARSETAARLTQCRSQGIVQRAGGTGPVLPVVLALPPRMRGRNTT